ncbi:MAG: SLBB domain-containing protein [Desulfocapsaceae bacterium]|nr:SLBB domain-containing protein [Desulfocapsaceae bacterium]
MMNNIPQKRSRFLLGLFCLFILITSHQTLWADDYIVGPGDVLRITVYDHDDLKTTVRITEDGFIVMPLLGQVKVGGMKTSDIAAELSRQLADGYTVNPQVNIFIEEFRSKKAVALGHVNKPGLIELRGTTTFLELLSQAGGLKEEAGDTATIKRSTDGKQEIIVVNIKTLVEGGDLSQNIPIQAGDTVFIPKGGMCYVTGEVDKPDAYTCDNQTTVLKLITLAGGFTGKASKSGIQIVRIVDTQKTILKDVEFDTPVLANDIIVVPESFF